MPDQTVLPRRSDGCDWGGARVVLATDGRRLLWWKRSHKAWEGRLEGYRPQPAELELADMVDRTIGVPKTTTLHEGGRLSAALLVRYAERIDAFFGREVAAYLDPRQTLDLRGSEEDIRAWEALDPTAKVAILDACTGGASGRARFVRSRPYLAIALYRAGMLDDEAEPTERARAMTAKHVRNLASKEASNG